jgi:hypothetical protein
MVTGYEVDFYKDVRAIRVELQKIRRALQYIAMAQIQKAGATLPVEDQP